MAQFEYQVLEQAGGRVSHMNERIMLLVNEGWEPTMMTGAAPHISLLMRRPMSAAAAAPGPAVAQAQATPAAPRPAPPAAAPNPAAAGRPPGAQPGVPPRPATP